MNIFKNRPVSERLWIIGWNNWYCELLIWTLTNCLYQWKISYTLVVRREQKNGRKGRVLSSTMIIVHITVENVDVWSNKSIKKRKKKGNGRWYASFIKNLKWNVLPHEKENWLIPYDLFYKPRLKFSSRLTFITFSSKNFNLN